MLLSPLVDITSQIWILLMEHNCVIVPKLGGFVGNYQSAEINTLNHKIYPPNKAISFNKNLTKNDGLLINHIANTQNISYNEAEQQVNIQAQSILQRLNQNESIQIYRVGKLFFDSLQNLRFEPYKKYNLLADAFGLDEVLAIPYSKLKSDALVAEQQQIVKPPVAQTKETPASKQIIKKIHYRQLAAAAAIILFILYGMYLGFQTNLMRGGNFHLSELNPFSSKVCEVYMPRTIQSPDILKPEYSVLTIPDSAQYIQFSILNADESFIGDGIKTVRLIETQIAVSESTRVKDVVIPSISSGYQIIVGCFAEQSNAEQLVESLKNKGFINASVLDYWRGLHRVRLDVYPTKTQALENLNTIKQNISPGAWVVKK